MYLVKFVKQEVIGDVNESTFRHAVYGNVYCVQYCDIAYSLRFIEGKAERFFIF